ncbi:MAG: 50S ribosomal protein L24 [Bacteroidia bacterium]|nr:50S ribosomal protein L24 [Bacteroidia bacterium]
MQRKYNKQTKLHVKKGDMVLVITGDDKGKKGRILEVFNTEKRALVEGINIVSRHTKPNAQNQQGGIIKKEARINISNLKVIDKTGIASRVGRKVTEEGKIVRVSKKSGEVIE